VVVAGGLSVAPTVHRMEFVGRIRFTCCAFDALGILGALETDGVIESTSPETGAPLRVTFRAGRPEASDTVLFYADDACCTSILDEWCPKVNFFEGPEVAAPWAERTGIVGTVVGLGEATGRAAREWAPLVARQP
jgi:Alkylmercury lyase